jgi:hypothetical protein
MEWDNETNKTVCPEILKKHELDFTNDVINVINHVHLATVCCGCILNLASLVTI